MASELARVDLKSEADVQTWFVCDEIKTWTSGGGREDQY